ncbi:MAG: HAD hydrolase family protein, partial [Methanotrichaceae archaeon]|nr:HAD hydrolase family protein [Methanotrichaceae archaeon]
QRDFDVQAATRQLQVIGLEVELIDTVFAVHIKDARVNKGTGLKRVAERLRIPLEEFAAVGDSNSDIPMFELAGFRASVGNASPELKAISDYVAGDYYGRGFLEIAKHMNEYRML